MSKLDLFLSLSKIDLDQRIVHGIATAEVPDRVGEICDYSSTKPYFEAWSAEALAASGGKSLGAVRAMHGKVAAGKLTDIAFDDEGKRIPLDVKKGDEVLYSKYGGTEIKVDGEDLLVLRESDVLARVE